VQYMYVIVHEFNKLVEIQLALSFGVLECSTAYNLCTYSDSIDNTY
jgi:hypothetical protein